MGATARPPGREQSLGRPCPLCVPGSHTHLLAPVYPGGWSPALPLPTLLSICRLAEDLTLGDSCGSFPLPCPPPLSALFPSLPVSSSQPAVGLAALPNPYLPPHSFVISFNSHS